MKRGALKTNAQTKRSNETCLRFCQEGAGRWIVGSAFLRGLVVRVQGPGKRRPPPRSHRSMPASAWGLP
jgi:hypothetical protein